LRPSNYRATCGPNPTAANAFIPGQDWGGCMFQDSRIKFEQVTDGSSNTLIIGECIFDYNAALGTGRWAAIWPGMRGTDTAVHISDIMWWMDTATATINGTAPQAFSSNHASAGAYFLFLDGTVRYLRQEADPNLLIWLSGRNDGNILDLTALTS